MATTLKYNGLQIASGQPTPLVGESHTSVKYGERWAEIVSITLNGQITGCPADFSGLVDSQISLLSVFNKDFGAFEIYDGTGLVYKAENCVIKNGVRFGSSRYNGLIPYSVDLETYPEELFSGYYGVLDPQDSWEISEEDGGRFTATHTIAARGLITTTGASDALDNAIAFVNSRTGNFEYATPYFVSSSGNWQTCPKTIREQKNRFNGTYSLSISYNGSSYDTDENIVRYSTEVSCDSQNGLLEVDLRGTVEGCSQASIDDVRLKYLTLDLTGIIADTASGVYINPHPTVSGIEENPFVPSLSFRLSYDNFSGAYPYFSYRTVAESGDSDIINVKVDGQILHRGNNTDKWDDMLAFLPTIDLFDIADSGYQDFGGSGSLNAAPRSSGVSFNRFGGEIRLNAEFDDKAIPVSGFEDFNYSLEYLPSLQKLTVKPLLATAAGTLYGEEYYVCDLGYRNRCEFSVKGNGVIACGYTVSQGVQNVKNFANSLFSGHCPTSKALLETNNITTGINSINFDFRWSADSANNVVIPRTNYKNIDSLLIL